MLQKQFGINAFKAPEGWLDKFKSRHTIVCKTLSGEGVSSTQANVEQKIVIQKKEQVIVFLTKKEYLFIFTKLNIILQNIYNEN